MKAPACAPRDNNKLLKFAQTNTNTAFEFAKRLLDVKSPSEFIELSTERTRKQFETLTEQTTELAALAQRVTLASTEPLKAGVTKAFGQASRTESPLSVVRSPGSRPSFVLSMAPTRTMPLHNHKRLPMGRSFGRSQSESVGRS